MATDIYFRQEKCHLQMAVHMRAPRQIIYLILHVDMLVEDRCSTREVKTPEKSGSGWGCLSTVWEQKVSYVAAEIPDSLG